MTDFRPLQSHPEFMHFQHRHLKTLVLCFVNYVGMLEMFLCYVTLCPLFFHLPSQHFHSFPLVTWIVPETKVSMIKQIYFVISFSHFPKKFHHYKQLLRWFIKNTYVFSNFLSNKALNKVHCTKYIPTSLFLIQQTMWYII